ncbi:hypothetical protein [Qipengyuania atrilutea]|uniref:Cytochrome c domain-containing protein n=1 Tax=Qipengyuania atrilutea TaxID=2744473 RepID=A0A850H1S9_9SPHN|nr:hypothetical protein [Actirhodobacter atriluteus]NVD45921.1 hypothetical protein [Actirhodobacter atriluteus]
MRSNHVFLMAGSAILFALAAPAPAFAQGNPCDPPSKAAEPKKKKRGLGGLFGALKGAGIEGSIAGALRGDGNLKADLQDAAQRAVMSAAEEAVRAEACRSVPEGADEMAADTTAQGLDETISEPRPTPSKPDFRYPVQAMIPAEKQAEFAAYAALGEVRCTGCEGGTTNQGWFKPMLADEMRELGTNLHDAMLTWAPGQGAEWKGTDVNGSITAEGEIMMGGLSRGQWSRWRVAGRTDRRKRSCWLDDVCRWADPVRLLRRYEPDQPALGGERWLDRLAHRPCSRARIAAGRGRTVRSLLRAMEDAIRHGRDSTLRQGRHRLLPHVEWRALRDRPEGVERWQIA